MLNRVFVKVFCNSCYFAVFEILFKVEKIFSKTLPFKGYLLLPSRIN